MIDIYAASGHRDDIQEAVNQVLSIGGVGNVHIPAGVWIFIEVGAPWVPVECPAGVNIFGAPTQRTSNDQVVEWKTILVMPFDAAPSGPPDKSVFIEVQETDPQKTTRISDIQFVGYREIDPTNPNWHRAITIKGDLIDFRIDHNHFKNCSGGGAYIMGNSEGMFRGVIDHNRFVNDYGYVYWDWLECSVAYGIGIRAVMSSRWEMDISKVLGKYGEYHPSVYIEDNYFSRWRHCVSSNDGVHYVFRHNTIEHDSMVGSLDGHGSYDASPDPPDWVGTRAMEFYDNRIIYPVNNFGDPSLYDSVDPAPWAYGVDWRGGGGVFFNNFMKGYSACNALVNEGIHEKCWPHDIWFWNNTYEAAPGMTYGVTPIFVIQTDTSDPVEGEDYFLHKPPGYKIYPYPHPLTRTSPKPSLELPWWLTIPIAIAAALSGRK